MQRLYPVNENGFIDEKKVFQVVVGTLKLPLNYLDELTAIEIGWLLENHIEQQMEHYEFIASAVSFGYISAKKGKKVKMFKKYDNDKVGQITQEQKEREKQYIESIFLKEGESN